MSAIVNELYLLRIEVVISAAMQRNRSSVELRHVKQSRFTQETLFVDYKPGWRFKLAAEVVCRPRKTDQVCIFVCFCFSRYVGDCTGLVVDVRAPSQLCGGL